jgi:transposase
MKRFLFIGIDFSKSKFDVSVLEEIEQKKVAQASFENRESGYRDFLKWTSKESKTKRDDWRFCGEHTGLYSRGLSQTFLQKNSCLYGLKIRFKSSKVRALNAQKTTVSIRLSSRSMPGGL